LIPVDYLLILEGLILLAAGVIAGIAEIFGRGNPNDELKRLTRAFWREFARPTGPAVVRGFEAIAIEEHASASVIVNKSKGQAKPAVDPNVTSTLNVKVIAGSRDSRIVGRQGSVLEVQVTAQPEGGEANKAVIDLLAEALLIQGWKIKLIRGHYDTRKTLQIAGLSTEEVQSRLSKLL